MDKKKSQIRIPPITLTKLGDASWHWTVNDEKNRDILRI